MDKKEYIIKSRKSNAKNQEQEIKTLLKTQGDDPLGDSELSTPETDPLDDIFEQRQRHRDKLLNSITKIMWASFSLLSGLLIVQSLVRILRFPQFILIDSTTLQILSVSVFGQIIGVVFIISKALWDDKNYMDLFKS